jgi:predicted dithiol-disulfide oxidoreductase (DUF899 family)
MISVGMDWPNESVEYRRARDELLEAEVGLRRQEEAVALQRRALPLGGELMHDYEFEGPSGAVRFTDLFEGGKATLYLYNFMFVPSERGLPLEVACPDCTSIIDGMDGAIRHLLQRVNVAIVAKAPIEQFSAWGQSRGWQFAPLFSSSRSTFNHDYNAEATDGSQLPVAHVFSRLSGTIYHRWSSEMMSAARDEGQHPRHVDYMWPIWKVLDVTPEGRGADWRPEREYAT